MTCVHRWLCDLPKDGVVAAVCSKCGASRDFDGEGLLREKQGWNGSRGKVAGRKKYDPKAAIEAKKRTAARRRGARAGGR